MSDPTLPIKACRYCQHYQSEGRRGGHCSQLNVSVQSAWKPCRLAIPLFETQWSEAEELVLWPVVSIPIVNVASVEVMSSKG